MAVPLTEQDRQQPELKYFEREMVPPPEGTFERIEHAVLPADKLHSIFEMDKLFDEGYMENEFGYGNFEDGTLVAMNLLQMPGITPEMFAWFFAWHGLKPIRYKLWDKEEHYEISTSDPEKRKDPSVPIKERIWDTFDFAEEYNPTQGVHTVPIHFRNPADIGFSKEKLEHFDGMIVCAGDEKAPAVMVHFVRPVEGGSELRTRFWMGYSIIDGKPVKTLPEGKSIPQAIGKNILTHNNIEFSNLIGILPELYEEFKNYW